MSALTLHTIDDNLAFALRRHADELGTNWKNGLTCFPVRKLMMIVAYPPSEASAEGSSMRGVVAVAFGAWAETETVGGYTWTYRINGDSARNFQNPALAICRGNLL